LTYNRFGLATQVGSDLGQLCLDTAKNTWMGFA